VARLRLLRAAVAAGHPIGTIASLSDEELRRRGAPAPEDAGVPLRSLLEAIERLDAEATERALGLQMAALGPRRFATEVAAPLLREVGDAWAAGRMGIASEHMASAIVRNLLGSALRRRATSGVTGPIVFATPAGERHELGALVGAVAAAEAGGNVTWLGSDTPVAEIARAAVQLGARAVALGLVTIEEAEGERAICQLRNQLPAECELWIGGDGASRIDLPPGSERIEDLEALERKIALLRV
jgi:methanogenic corrinoid protein MtbC1